ncbi:uncharacterized protein LOC144293670 isoform X2 [Canis aureus]
MIWKQMILLLMNRIVRRSVVTQGYVTLPALFTSLHLITSTFYHLTSSQEGDQTLLLMVSTEIFPLEKKTKAKAGKKKEMKNDGRYFADHVTNRLQGQIKIIS